MNRSSHPVVGLAFVLIEKSIVLELKRFKWLDFKLNNSLFLDFET